MKKENSKKEEKFFLKTGRGSGVFLEIPTEYEPSEYKKAYEMVFETKTKLVSNEEKNSILKRQKNIHNLSDDSIRMIKSLFGKYCDYNQFPKTDLKRYDFLSESKEYYVYFNHIDSGKFVNYMEIIPVFEKFWEKNSELPELYLTKTGKKIKYKIKLAECVII